MGPGGAEGEGSLREPGETVGRLAHDAVSLQTHHLLHADSLLGPIARGLRAPTA